MFQEDLNNLIKMTGEVILIFTQNAEKLLYASPAYEEVWGMSCDSLSKDPLSFLSGIDARDRPKVEEIFYLKKTSSYLSSEGSEFRVMRPDGSVRHVWCRFFIEAKKLSLVILDITEQRRRSLLGKTVTEALPNLNYIFDVVDRKAVFLGGKGYELLGYSPEDEFGSPQQILKTLHPDDLAQLDQMLARWNNVKDGAVLKTEFRLKDKGGGWRFFLSADTVYSRTPEGRVKEIIGTAQDITEVKLADEARRRSDERFKRYFDLGLVGIAVTSPEKGWLEVNDCCCEMLGYSRDELKRKTWTEITYPDDLEADITLFNQLLAGRIESYVLDKRFVRKDGTPIYTSIAISCVRKENGEPDHIVALIQDISARKKAERELSQYRDHLEELVRARTAELYEANEKLRQEIIERRQVEEVLQKKNIALNEILGQIEMEKKVVREQIMANVERLLLPTIKKLSVEDSELRQDYIALLVRNLKEMTSSFGSNITSAYYKLTPREIEICNMIKSRLSNKEISKLLSISLRTVETHRNDIRKKLNLSHKHINLATYLQTL